MTFEQAIAFVLAHEGGDVDDPRDPGGRTRWGISARAHPNVDMDWLTRDGAVAIYRTLYWTPIRGDDLPPALRLPMLDAAVQHGVRQAVKMLQLSLGVQVDGVLGPFTLQAAHGLPWAPLVVDLLARRARLYAQIPQQSTFGLGWYRRVFDCHRAIYETVTTKEAPHA